LLPQQTSAKTSAASAKLKAIISERERPRSARTAFKLLPKTSQLLDWMLDTTKMSVTTLFRTEMEFVTSSVVGHFFVYQIAGLFKLHRIQVSSELKQTFVEYINSIHLWSSPGLDDPDPSFLDLPQMPKEILTILKKVVTTNAHRRSVALDADLVQQIEAMAKQWRLSRDVYVNLLIYQWAHEWYKSLQDELKEIGPKTECIEQAFDMIFSPDFNELQSKYRIEDPRFWKDLQNAWLATEAFFRFKAEEAIPNDADRKRAYCHQYERIIGKME